MTKEIEFEDPEAYELITRKEAEKEVISRLKKMEDNEVWELLYDLRNGRYPLDG